MSNFGLITCLPIIWKLLTDILGDELYQKLEKIYLLPWKQEGYRKGSRNTKVHLRLDNMILKDCKGWLASLVVTLIGYLKANDMTTYGWIQKCMEVLGDSN